MLSSAYVIRTDLIILTKKSVKINKDDQNSTGRKWILSI